MEMIIAILVNLLSVAISSLFQKGIEAIDILKKIYFIWWCSFQPMGKLKKHSIQASYHYA